MQTRSFFFQIHVSGFIVRHQFNMPSLWDAYPIAFTISVVIFLSLQKQPFITAQSQVITAHFVYHCTVFKFVCPESAMDGKKSFMSNDGSESDCSGIKFH